MRKTHIDHLRPGQVLGKTIYSERGDVLLSRGVTLTQRYIDALRAQGFYAAYILDGFADDVEPPDLLSDRVRMATYKHVRELFNVAYSAVPVPMSGLSHSRQMDFVSAARPHLAQLYSDVERIIDEVSNIATVSGVVSLKSHDNYTFEHSIDVTVVGVTLGQRMNLAPEDIRQLALGCLCHDIGKLAVPAEILLKPGRLTPEERESVERHSQAGYEAVQQIVSGADIIARQVVWQHHEKQDGTGYPRHLKGSNRFLRHGRGGYLRGLILPAAEVAAVADVYSALASDRPYRPALDPPAAATALRQMAGPHLNREIISRFLSILPAYPVGTEVIIIAGKLNGYKGVVSELNPRDIHRPRVRILFAPDKRPVDPFEVNTSIESDVELAMSSYADLAHPCSAESLKNTVQSRSRGA